MASIRDVAEKAGVSIGTVSHVLNGNGQARISVATQERVRGIAIALGYRPNRLARSLWRGKTDTIGLLVSGLQNPFFVEVLEAAQRLAIEAGYQVLVDSGPSVKGTYNAHPRISDWPVDAALAWTNPDQSITSFIGANGSSIPTVYLGFERKDGSDWVAFDLYEGTMQLAKHLAERGYRRVGFVSAYEIEKSSQESRYRAYCDACALYAWEPRLYVTEGEQETRSAATELGSDVARLGHDRPDALLCHNDILAVGVACGLERAGVLIPNEIAVAGFDGIEEGQFRVKPLTTVRTDPEELVRAALEMLYERMNSGNDGKARTKKIPAQLLIGGTT